MEKRTRRRKLAACAVAASVTATVVAGQHEIAAHATEDQCAEQSVRCEPVPADYFDAPDVDWVDGHGPQVAEVTEAPEETDLGQVQPAHETDDADWVNEPASGGEDTPIAEEASRDGALADSVEEESVESGQPGRETPAGRATEGARQNTGELVVLARIIAVIEWAMNYLFDGGVSGGQQPGAAAQWDQPAFRQAHGVAQQRVHEATGLARTGKAKQPGRAAPNGGRQAITVVNSGATVKTGEVAHFIG